MPPRRQGAKDESRNPLRRQGALDESRNPLRRQGALDESRNPLRRQGALDGRRNLLRRQGAIDEDPIPLRRQNAIDEDEIPPESIFEISYQFTPPIILIETPFLTTDEILQKVKSEKVEDHIAVCQSIRKWNPHIEDIIKSGVLQALVEYLKRSDSFFSRALQVEATCAITNVVSGSSDLTKAVVTYGAVPPLIDMMRSGSNDVAEQAVLCLGNFARDCPDLREFLLHSWDTCYFVKNVIPSLVKLLEISDPEMLMVVLDGLFNVLESAKKLGEIEKVAKVIEEAGGVDKLEELQKHENANVYKKVHRIIMLYFNEEEVAENNPSSIPSFPGPSFYF